jgi:hypothetical protein
VDFVVVGFGVGALGVLLGVLLRGWRAPRCERAAARAADPAVAAYERANAAECLAAGQAFLAAGGAVVLATVGGLAGGMDDRSGAVLVATTATVAALGIILWGYLHRSRHPMPARPRRRVTNVETRTPSALAPEPETARPDPGSAHDKHQPAGGDVAAAVDAEEPPLAEPTDLEDSPDADAAAEAVDASSGEHAPEDAGAKANGHPADAMAAAETGKVVAFVERNGRTHTAERVVADDDESDER